MTVPLIAFCGGSGSGRTTASMAVARIGLKLITLSSFDQFADQKYKKLEVEFATSTTGIVISDVTTDIEVNWLKSVGFKVIYVYNPMINVHSFDSNDHSVPLDHLIPMQICDAVLMNINDEMTLINETIKLFYTLFPDVPLVVTETKSIGLPPAPMPPTPTTVVQVYSPMIPLMSPEAMRMAASAVIIPT